MSRWWCNRNQDQSYAEWILSEWRLHLFLPQAEIELLMVTARIYFRCGFVPFLLVENQMETVDRFPSVAVRIDPEPDHSFLSLLSPPISEDFWSRKKFDWSLELSVASYTRDPSRIKLSGSILAGFPETRAWMGFLLKSPNKSVRFHVRFLIRNGVSSTPILRLSAWIDPAPSWWSGYEIRHLDQRQLYGQRIKTWCVIWNSDEIRSSRSQSGSILPSRHFPFPRYSLEKGHQHLTFPAPLKPFRSITSFHQPAAIQDRSFPARNLTPEPMINPHGLWNAIRSIITHSDSFSDFHLDSPADPWLDPGLHPWPHPRSSNSDRSWTWKSSSTNADPRYVQLYRSPYKLDAMFFLLLN